MGQAMIETREVLNNRYKDKDDKSLLYWIR